MGFVFTFKRLIVIALAVAIAVLSIVSITHSPSTLHLVIGIIVIVISIFGAIGALVEDPRPVQLFLVMLICFFIYFLVYIIVAAVAYDYDANDLLYDIVVCILFAIAICITSDVAYGAYYGRSWWGGRGGNVLVV